MAEHTILRAALIAAALLGLAVPAAAGGGKTSSDGGKKSDDGGKKGGDTKGDDCDKKDDDDDGDHDDCDRSCSGRGDDPRCRAIGSSAGAG